MTRIGLFSKYIFLPIQLIMKCLCPPLSCELLMIGEGHSDWLSHATSTPGRQVATPTASLLAAVCDV